MNTAIFTSVKKILVERFVIDAALIQPEADLETTLNLDSMDAVDLLSVVNETFKVAISEQSFETVHTIADLVAVISEQDK